jgi:hypothetical protein
MSTAEVVKFVGAVLGVAPSAQEIAEQPLHLGSTCQALAGRSSVAAKYAGNGSSADSAEVRVPQSALHLDLGGLLHCIKLWQCIPDLRRSRNG